MSVKLVVGPRQNTGASAGSSQRCVTAVHVDVTATPEPVVVDWGGATLTVDGENVSVAGDAPLGGLTADLEPAAHGCLAADDARTRKLTLEVPLRVGDATGRLRVDATRRVLSVDEKTALALVNAPQEMPPPDHKQPPFPTESAAIGAGIGAAIGALALGGLVFAASLRVYNTSVSNGDYLIPVVNGGIGLVPGCCAGFTAGGFVGLAVGLAKDDAAHGDTSTHKPPREASAGGYAAVASSKPPATTARAPEKRTNHSRRASADPGPTERTVVPPS
ncbi:MAG: hypothetical protein HYS27_10975 [Deltaproteobacteria bacterium]|nr:hypothetical protein [Deltaproteobacteria bacterium]